MESKNENYESPQTSFAVMSDEILETVPSTNTPMAPGAKKGLIYDDEEESTSNEVVWDDEE